MRKVGIDNRGSYYYLDTGEDAILAFYEDTPYDVYTGEDVMLVVADGGDLLEITDDVKDVLIAIFGNANQIPASAQIPNQARTPAVITPRVAYPQTQEQSSGGLFSGGKISISSETAVLIGIGVLVFAFGKSRGR